VDLNAIWFVLVGVLLTGYAVLDGFDLGSGPLLLLTPEDRERRIILNAIGPVWSGNEVWLVTGAGALFAAFPNVYATVFSGFYDLFLLLLAALIFRAAAIEFRSRRPGPGWRRGWDRAFAAASVLSAFPVGVALGNLVWGVPLDGRGEFSGTSLSLLTPYPLLVGTTAVALMTMHANLFLLLKTEPPLLDRLARLAKATIPLYLACFVLLNAATLVFLDSARVVVTERWWLLGPLCAASFAVTLAIPGQVRRGRIGRAFVLSCLSIASLMALFGATVFPRWVIARPNIADSLTIHNGAATAMSLRFMLVVALIGVPIVVAYTISIYWVFRGKVRLTEESY
jgi:cytochrome d ubiquinol oxidase subunit II